MAVMATEQSQEVQMEGKPVEGQAKAAANGRASATEPTEGVTKPGVNGNHDINEEEMAEEAESVVDTDDIKDVANQDAFSSNQAVSTKPDMKAGEAAKVEQVKKTDKEPEGAGKVERAEEAEPTPKDREEKEDSAMDEVKVHTTAPAESTDAEMKDVEKNADDGKTADADTDVSNSASSTAPPIISKVGTPPKSEAQPAVATKPTEVNGAKDTTGPGADDVLGDPRISQLAIDKDGEPSQSIPANDVAMTDAPHSSSSSSPSQGTKVARERDEDAHEEPAAKRVRTETDGEAKRLPEHVADKSSAGAEALDKIPRWLDSHFDSLVINDHMRKAYRHVLALAKKTTGGMSFRDSVEKLWPSLWENYTEHVHNPMDLGEIDRRMRDGKYTTVGQFRDDLSLIYLNCVTFNGADNSLVKQAEQTLTTVWRRVLEVRTNEPSGKPAKPAPVRHESRSKNPPPPAAPPPRRQSQSQTAVMSLTEASEAAPAVPASGMPQIRRASTLSEGNRPKRTIRAPKNKDIDYTKSPKKKLKPELQFCEEVLNELVAPKNVLLNVHFLDPVLNIPAYFQVIKKPMDLGTIGNKLAGGEYQGIKQFDADVKLMFANCYKFNDKGDVVTHAAVRLEQLYKSQMENKNQWLATHVPKASPTVPSYHGSDAESDDDADADAAPEPQAVGSAIIATIETLQTKMKEEMDKLTELFNDSNPNQALITLQQNVVQTVQAALLQEKQRAASQAPAPKASTKAKPSKPSKSKPAKEPNSSKRASTGAPRKSAPAPSKKKRRLTDEEKALIPDAIGRLQEPEVNLAIDWIKKDTGQAENGDGEIELDMDQISPDCLLRLFNLCKKAGILADPAADPPAAASPPSQSAKTVRPKGKTKNKPMSASEQDRKIEELRAVEARFKGGNPASHSSASAQAGEQHVQPEDESSSEDESSEEE